VFYASHDGGDVYSDDDDDECSDDQIVNVLVTENFREDEAAAEVN